MKKIICIAISFVMAVSCIAEARNALLIANAKYQNFGSLATPINEARDLKKTLETLGFSVTILENASMEKMQDAVDSFGAKLAKQGGIGFFHYGGHAVQVNGANYLIPVNADIPDEKRVKTRTLCVDDVTAAMTAETNIIVLDACRNNPLPASSGRSATRGLVLTVDHPKNSIIIYSAQPGNVAQDGVFTPILTKCLLEQKELGAILRDVRREVSAKTNGEQKPGEYNELEVEIYLAGHTTIKQEEQIKQIEQNEKKIEENIVEKKMPVLTEKSSTSTEQPSTFTEQPSTVAKWITQGESAYQKGNFKKAFKYYEKAALAGNAEAQCKLGEIYLNYYKSIGLEKADTEKAVYWLSKAVAQNHAEAQYQLGCIYYYDKYKMQDLAKAKTLFEAAAAQDKYRAQEQLGDIYHLEKRDYEKARYWYEKAGKNAENARPEAAQFTYSNIALFYNVTMNDKVRAKYWYEKAAAAGSYSAKKVLEEEF